MNFWTARSFSLLFFLTALFYTGNLPVDEAQAQNNSIQSYEGVSGDMDKGRRSPNLTVEKIVTDDGVKLLVDIFVVNEEFAAFPVQLDYYVNRKLFTSQIRSEELPGAVGVDIGPDIAEVPFNFTIVANILHPNRSFTTVFNGAVFNNDFARNLDCTLSIGSIEQTEYVASGVNVQQQSISSFALQFQAASLTDTGNVGLETTVSINGSSATANLKLDEDGVAREVPVTGTVSLTDGRLTLVDLFSDDGEYSLVCS